MKSPKDLTNKWVAVQLSNTGEKEKNLDLIKRFIFKTLKNNVEVFIPSVSLKRQDESQTFCFMEGYIFIRYQEGINYFSLESAPYFKLVLKNPSGSIPYSLIDDKNINPMKDGLDNMKKSPFTVGDRVKVMKGDYKRLEGEVSLVSDDSETIQIFINMSSKKLLIDFPSSYLKKVSEI